MKLLIKTIACAFLKTRCLCCSRVMKAKDSQTIYAKFGLCQSCYKKMPFIYQHFNLIGIPGLAIYEYSGLIKESLLALKVNGDCEIAKIFFGPIAGFLRLKYTGYTILPVPSIRSQDRLRTFNHVYEIAKILRLPIEKAFVKTQSWKQSGKSQTKRTYIRKVLKLTKELDPTKKYLIVDDIMTTGETLKACINLIKPPHRRTLKILVVAIHKNRKKSRKTLADFN